MWNNAAEQLNVEQSSRTARGCRTRSASWKQKPGKELTGTASQGGLQVTLCQQENLKERMLLSSQRKDAADEITFNQRVLDAFMDNEYFPPLDDQSDREE